LTPERAGNWFVRSELNNKKIWEEGKPYSAPLPSSEDLKNISKEAPLLDIGCGYGRLLAHLHDMGFSNLFGVDYVMAPMIRINFARVVAGRAEALPFKSDIFRASFLVGVLSNLVEDERRSEVFREAARVLTTGGILFVSAFAINKYYEEKYKKGEKEFGRYGIFRSSSGGVFRHVSEEELVKLLSLSGFKIESFKRLPFTTMHGNPAEGFVVLARKY